jgi:putative cell wall-binding protein
MHLVLTNSDYSPHALNYGIVVSGADYFQCAMLSELLTHFIIIVAFKGIAVDQAVFRRALIAEARFSSQPMRDFLFLQWHCDKFLSEYSSFSCQ